MKGRESGINHQAGVRKYGVMKKTISEEGSSDHQPRTNYFIGELLMLENPPVPVFR